MSSVGSVLFLLVKYQHNRNHIVKIDFEIHLSAQISSLFHLCVLGETSLQQQNFFHYNILNTENRKYFSLVFQNTHIFKNLNLE